MKGLGLLEQARALAQEAGDREQLSHVCNSLGAYNWWQGEHAKAIAEYEQARAVAVERSHRQNEGRACANLGLCYMSLKEYDKAIELFQQALAIDEELGIRSVQASNRVSLGRCLSRHGQYDRAVACLKQAWAGFQELGDAGSKPLAAWVLGEALWAQARAEHHQAAPHATTSCCSVSVTATDTLRDAETWLRTAIDLAVQQKVTNFRMEVQIHLACVATLKGDENEWMMKVLQRRAPEDGAEWRG